MMEEEADDVVFDSAQLIKRRGADSSRTRDRICHRPAKLRKGRLSQTSVIFASFICLGLSAAVTGPTLPYFKEKFQLDVGKLSYIFSARCLGYVIGSVTGSVAFERFGREHLLLAGGTAAGALSLAVAPFTSSLLLLCCVLATTGLADGFLHSGGVTHCYRQWGSRSRSVEQWLYFAIGVGALFASLLCTAFIADSTSAAVGSKGALSDAVVLPEAGKYPLALPKRQLLSAVSIGSANGTALSLPPSLLSSPSQLTNSDSRTSSYPAFPTSAAASSASLAEKPTTVEPSSSTSSVVTTASPLISPTTAAFKSSARPQKPHFANGNFLSQNEADAAGHNLGERVKNDRDQQNQSDNLPPPKISPGAAAGSGSVLNVDANLTIRPAAAVSGATDMPLSLNSTGDFSSTSATLNTSVYVRLASQVVNSDENATDINYSSSNNSIHADPTEFYRTNESTLPFVDDIRISSTVPSFPVTINGSAAAVLPTQINDTAGSSALTTRAVGTDEASAQLASLTSVTSASVAAIGPNVSHSVLPPSAHVQTDNLILEVTTELSNQQNVTVLPVSTVGDAFSSPSVEMTSGGDEVTSSTLAVHSTTIAIPLNVENNSTDATVATSLPDDSAQNKIASSPQAGAALTTVGAISMAVGQSTTARLRTTDLGTSATSTSSGGPGKPEPSSEDSTAGRSTVVDADAEPRSEIIDRHRYNSFIDDIQLFYLIASAMLLLVSVGFMCLAVEDRHAIAQPPTLLPVKDALAVGDVRATNNQLELHSSLFVTPSPHVVAAGSSGTQVASRILALAFVVCVLYVGVEVSAGQLLPACALQSKAVPSEHGATLLVAAFWGAFAFSRCLTAIAFTSSSCQLSRNGCLSPASLLSFGLAVSCVALVVLSFSGDVPTATWAGSAVLGGGLAPIFPACLAWTQEYADLGAARIRAALVGGSSLGGIVLPAIAGHFLVRFAPTFAFYTLLGAAGACAAAFAFAWYTSAMARGSSRVCCIDSRASYEAVATDALPIDDGLFAGPHKYEPPPENRYSKRNTGHKTVSFRLLDDDSDKEV